MQLITDLKISEAKIDRMKGEIGNFIIIVDFNISQ